MRELIAVGIVVVLITMFFGAYLLNRRTPRPDGCEINEENCKGCTNPLCNINKNKEKGDSV